MTSRDGVADESRWWPRLGLLDWIAFGLLSVVMISLCVVRSRTHLFWIDELFGFSVLRDPNPAHVLRGWWEGSDGGGPLYYLIAFVWFRLFGATLLDLRLLSTACFLLGIGLIWALARRFFSLPVVAFVIAAVFLLPPYLVFQEGNGRFYGLFLATAAFAAACTMAAVEWRGGLTGQLGLICCAHACLVGSHILGIAYSAGLLAALVASDLLEGRRRLPLYGSVLLAWGVVLPLSSHAMRATAAVAHGVFWTVRPHVAQLVFGLFSYSGELFALAALLLVTIAIRAELPTASPPEARQTGRSRRSIGVGVGGLLLGQLVLFTKSQVGVSIYSDRYLLPLTIALVLLLCHGLTRTLGARWIKRLSRPVPTIAVAVASIAGGLWYARRDAPYASRYAPLDYPREIEQLLPAQRVVVVSYAPTFLLMNVMDPTHRYIFLTDWTDAAKVGVDPDGQRVMRNAERGGSAAHQVLDLREVLAAYPEFTLLGDEVRLPRLCARLQRSGEFQVTAVGSLENWQPVTIWQVRCLHPGAGCGTASVGQR